MSHFVALKGLTKYMVDHNIQILVRRAKGGDKNALEQIVSHSKDYVYNLSLKMLLYPEDAKDATQEILIRIITRLSTFNHQSKFSTWVYRVATNYLITVKGKKSREFAMSFDEYANLIDMGQSDNVVHASNAGELKLLEEEVKVSCTQGLLLCLKPLDRAVYVLSEILEFNGKEGAEIMEMTPENFRKKLSRSRLKIRNFLNGKCGLANPNNACRCIRKVDFLIDTKIIESRKFRFAELSQRSIDFVEKLDELEKAVAIYRSVPAFEAPRDIFENIKSTVSNA